MSSMGALSPGVKMTGVFRGDLDADSHVSRVHIPDDLPDLLS